MLRRTASGLSLFAVFAFFAFFAVAACGDGGGTQLPDAGNSGFVLRCNWNPQSGRFDRDCTTVPTDPTMKCWYCTDPSKRDCQPIPCNPVDAGPRD
jgi:hypothetical protein